MKELNKSELILLAALGLSYRDNRSLSSSIKEVLASTKLLFQNLERASEVLSAVEGHQVDISTIAFAMWTMEDVTAIVYEVEESMQVPLDINDVQEIVGCVLYQINSNRDANVAFDYERVYSMVEHEVKGMKQTRG